MSGARRWAGFLRRKREQDFTTHLRGNVVAYLALFVALGGTSYAAATLPRNSVTAKQIAARAVGSAELKNGAVTSQKVRGLRLEDFKPGGRPSSPWRLSRKRPRTVPRVRPGRKARRVRSVR